VATVPLKRIGGTFFRSVLADRVDRVLEPPGPESAGRYHRPGQPALYITAEADWAAVVTGNYAAEDGLARVIVPLELDFADVLDQRDEAACAMLEIEVADATGRWRPHLREGREPPSWRNADAAREAGADGIIDPSRGIIGGWHVALFRWNQPGSPQLRVAGNPLPFDYDASRSRWPAPEGWQLGINQ
jgi:RES domain-containing protein